MKYYIRVICIGLLICFVLALCGCKTKQADTAKQSIEDKTNLVTNESIKLEKSEIIKTPVVVEKEDISLNDKKESNEKIVTVVNRNSSETHASQTLSSSSLLAQELIGTIELINFSNELGEMDDYTETYYFEGNSVNWITSFENKWLTWVLSDNSVFFYDEQQQLYLTWIWQEVDGYEVVDVFYSDGTIAHAIIR